MMIRIRSLPIVQKSNQSSESDYKRDWVELMIDYRQRKQLMLGNISPKVSQQDLSVKPMLTSRRLPPVPNYRL